MGVIILRDAATDAGEWVDFRDDIKLRLRRRIPDDVDLSLRRRTIGTSVSFTLTDVGRMHTYDSAQQRQFNLDRCAWAWTDASGLEIGAGDEAIAREITAQLGEEVKPGSPVPISGGKLTDAVKRFLLINVEGLEKRIFSYIVEEQKKTAGEEAGKGHS